MSLGAAAGGGAAPLPILVIAGPTASGKSRLGIELADRLHGEIVSADAFAVYRGLDIGTDKPASADRARVPHHLVDVADPGTRFSAGDFVRLARTAISAVLERNRTPVVVGGSCFYIDALLGGLFPAPPRDPELGARLHRLWEENPLLLRQRLEREDPVAAAAIGANDRQRVVRALEYLELTGSPISSRWKDPSQAPAYRPLLIVPERSRHQLYARIDERVDRMFAAGLVEETEGLLAAGVPPEAHALKAIGYRQSVSFLEGRSDRTEAVADTASSSRRLASRQLAWLRRSGHGEACRVPPAEMGGAEVLVEAWRSHLNESGLP